MRFGFGGGINFSDPQSTGEFQLYEDLSGSTSSYEYSSIFQNFGYQYYFLLEYQKDWWAVSIRPGTHSYTFSLENRLEYNNSTEILTNDFGLKYFTLPLEFKYIVERNGLRPFVGGVASWGRLLDGKAAENAVFIKNRITSGILTGAYYDTGSAIIVLGLGYNLGLHVITSKENRFNTAVSSSYSQDDIRLNDFFTNISILFSLEKKRRYSNTKCNY